jgi:hypothetical protein
VEIQGSERPEEVVLFGGHIDSWDVTDGAIDDGGGAMITWELSAQPFLLFEGMQLLILWMSKHR